MAYKGAQQDEKPITRSQYARLIGVSPAYISKLVKDGKIPTTPEGLIIPSVADASRLLHRDPARSHLVKSKLAIAERSEQRDHAEAYQKARAFKAEIDAELAQLELDLARGKVLDREETLAAFYALCRQARDRFLQIPVRCPPLLVGKRSEKQIAQVLETEVQAALEELPEANLGGTVRPSPQRELPQAKDSPARRVLSTGHDPRSSRGRPHAVLRLRRSPTVPWARARQP